MGWGRHRRATACASTFASVILVALHATAQDGVAPVPAIVPPWQAESPWYQSGRAAARDARARVAPSPRAKNVILFLGDGMSISTVTAARIRAGQLAGATGEEYSLSIDRFPFTAFSKTYTVDHQVADSAGTMTAIVTGVKTRSGVLGVDESVALGDYTTVADGALTTILDIAESLGMATGIVTTTRVTHGTPAALYAKSPDRQWEDDADMAALALAASERGFPDIARQLVEYPHGDGIEVVLGGGRSSFLPSSAVDPEDVGETGRRLDGRDLVREWLSIFPNPAFVWNRTQLFEIDPNTPSHVLGLFETEDMEYEHQRATDVGGEPSLTEMTQVAIRLLSRDPDGFFLMVEGGRIDHAHHRANAFTALGETIEFSNAIDAAVAMTHPEDTLIIVTADHGHTLTIGGYARRGNPILGLVEKPYEPTPLGVPERALDRDTCGLPFTTLTYANGPGHAGHCAVRSEEHAVNPVSSPGCRSDLSHRDTIAADYLQEGTVPLSSETHSGEDVGVYAWGARAQIVHGTIEQHVIFHLMLEAMQR
jgi:alkaline phosphatase